MKSKSINFGSIFRRKGALPQTDFKDQAGRGNLLARLAEREITLKEGEVIPLAKDTPSIDWTKVDGCITVLSPAIEGLLEGRARIKAQQLKNLIPCPIDRETADSIEYAVSLAAIVSQIDDLLSDNQPETGQPEFETPFTVLAREDNARFEQADKELNCKAGGHIAVGNGEPLTNGGETPQPIAKETLPLGPPVDLLAANHNAQITAVVDVPDRGRDEAEPIKVEPEARRTTIRETEPEKQPTSRWVPELQPWQLDESLARQGVERLQEIFMTSRPLDGRKVASLVRELPGINGALILLEGGVVLGGQLPDSLSLKAAVHAPEVLKNFTRFICEVEAGRKVQSEFVSVTAATTISFIASGEIVLLVSHQGKILPPGVAKRLTETAEALSLIYGNHH